MVGLKDGFWARGYERRHGVVSVKDCESLGGVFKSITPGQRIFERVGPLAIDYVSALLEDVVFSKAGQAARPVRMIYFDKSANANWSLGWHQDRTIAVKERAALNGFEPWTTKGGVCHVEPPFSYIEQSITIRLSIDPSNSENGALEVIAGTHKFGKLTDRQTHELALENNSDLLETGVGDIVVLSTPLLHRSGPSRVSQRRRTIQIDYSWAQLPPPLEWAFEV